MQGAWEQFNNLTDKKVIDQTLVKQNDLIDEKGKQKYDIDQNKQKLIQRQLIETEQILRQLFPDEDQEWIILSKLIHKEKQFSNANNHKSMIKNEPYLIHDYKNSELLVSETDLMNQILKAIEKMLPKKKTSTDFLKSIDTQLINLSKKQLIKTNEIVQILQKYTHIKVQQKIAQDFCQKNVHFDLTMIGEQLKQQFKNKNQIMDLKLGIKKFQSEDPYTKKCVKINNSRRQSTMPEKDLKTILSSNNSSEQDDRVDIMNHNNQMESKFMNLISIIKKNFDVTFMETQYEQKKTRKIRETILKKFSNTDEKLMLLQNFTFLAYMLGLRKVLNECFVSGINIDLGTAVERALDYTPEGIYSNIIVSELCKRMKVPVQDMRNFILPSIIHPSQESHIHNMRNNLVRLEQKYSILNKSHKIIDRGSDVNRIMPLIKSDGTFLLTQKLIDKQYAGQIDKFIKEIIDDEDYLSFYVKSIVINEVKIEPYQLLEILKMFKNRDSEQIQIRHLTLGSLVVSDDLLNFIFEHIIPHLYSLNLFKIQHQKGHKQNKMFRPLRDIIISKYPKHSKLVKLRICQVDLSKQIDPIIDLISYAWNSLLDLDLSWCDLTFDNFQNLSDCIKNISQEDADRFNCGNRRGTLRKLNISYNTFTNKNEVSKNEKCFAIQESNQNNDGNFNHAFQEVKVKKIEVELIEDNISDHFCYTNSQNSHDHQNFTDAFINLVKSQNLQKCTHLDISGIQALRQQKILELINELSDFNNCENLLAIHMNDLNINFNQKLKDEIIDAFSIQTNEQQNARTRGNLSVALKIFIEKIRGGLKYKQQNADKVNYLQIMKRALGHAYPQNTFDKSHNFSLAQQMQLIGEQKILSKAGYMSSQHGIGRLHENGSLMDNFILSRKHNFVPELVFNQCPQQDLNRKYGFFEQDHEIKWRLSDNNSSSHNSCYLCEKQKCCIIFYERNEQQFLRQSDSNRDLIEITDKEFIKNLRSEYNLKYCQTTTNLQKMTTPLIFGTPIRNSFGITGPEKISNLTFDRKLRMIRADLFALLSCCTNEQFIENSFYTNYIKQSICYFLRGEMNSRVEQLEIFSKLQGWNKLLHQKCNQNSCYPVQTVNQPDCVQYERAKPESAGSRHYIFQTYLKPGYHQFFIYDPLIDKVFCQELVVELETCSQIYPEIPFINRQLVVKILPNVFKKWIRDDIERENKAYYIDTSPFKLKGKEQRDNFEPERFIKDPVDLKQCENILKENFQFLQLLYQECLGTSSRYPEIDKETFWENLNKTFEYFMKNADQSLQYMIRSAEYEIQFISATRNDSKAERSLCRGEMLELILRIAHVIYRDVKIKQRRKNSRAQSSQKLNVSNSPTVKLSPKPNQKRLSNYSQKTLDNLVDQKVFESPTLNHDSQLAINNQSKLSINQSTLLGSELNLQKKILAGLESGINNSFQKQQQSDVSFFLEKFIVLGLQSFCKNGKIMAARHSIQDDPLVVKALATRLKELKKVYDYYTVRGFFNFQQSTLRLMEMSHMSMTSVSSKKDFWYPMTPRDLWQPFVYCMMTVIDEIHDVSKYQHLLAVEFYEWIARIAIKYYELQCNEFSDDSISAPLEHKHEQISQFLDKFLSRQQHQMHNRKLLGHRNKN